MENKQNEGRKKDKARPDCPEKVAIETGKGLFKNAAWSLQARATRPYSGLR